MTRIVGVDCATEEAKVAVALGNLDETGLEILDATACSRERRAASLVAEWLSDHDGPALIAVDAPLGWPKPLGESLSGHKAGMGLNVEAHAMFRRTTDMFIKEKLEKTPLDVGADRIARTAHSALRLLSELRSRLDAPIPLAWSPALDSGVFAIEVYPAATLVAHGIPSKGYRKATHSEQRREILDALCRHLRVRETVTDLCESPHLIDAAVCVLTGANFLEGRTMGPEDRALAEREGWIWSAPRQDRSPAVRTRRSARPSR